MVYEKEKELSSLGILQFIQKDKLKTEEAISKENSKIKVAIKQIILCIYLFFTRLGIHSIFIGLLSTCNNSLSIFLYYFY